MEAQKNDSLSRQVFQKLREDILNGKYKEHDELREMAVAEELKVSRTPVREALRQLELEGLVSSVANKGTFVNGICEKDVEDIYMIRSMLEGLCARWAADKITPEQLDQLEEMMLVSDYHLNKEETFNASLMARLFRKFHEVLYEASGSRILARILLNLQSHVRRVGVTKALTEEAARKFVRDHRQILHAVKERDSDMAEQLADEHIFHILQNLKSQESDRACEKVPEEKQNIE